MTKPILIQPGDTLARLGAKHGFNWRDAKIERASKYHPIGPGGIRPEHIRAGDYVLPPKTSTANPAKPNKTAEKKSPQRKSPKPKSSGPPPSSGPISADQLKILFPRASQIRLAKISEGLNENLIIGKIDSEIRMTHFLGQVREEIGAAARLQENLNYKAEVLPKLFSAYRRNPSLAQSHGRTATQKADQAAIANLAYAGRIGNGDAASGDGWRYRGRGMKQLTGRANYADFTRKHRDMWGEDLDFTLTPDLLLDPRYAVRSALYFWVANGLNKIADQGVSDAVVDQITKKINPGAQGTLKTNRRQHVRSIYDQRLFKTLGLG